MAWEAFWLILKAEATPHVSCPPLLVTWEKPWDQVSSSKHQMKKEVWGLQGVIVLLCELLGEEQVICVQRIQLPSGNSIMEGGDKSWGPLPRTSCQI